MDATTTVAIAVAGKLLGYLERSHSLDPATRASEDATMCDEFFDKAMASDVYLDLPWQQRTARIVRDLSEAAYGESDVLYEAALLEHWSKPIMLRLLKLSSRGRDVEHTPYGPRFVDELPPQQAMAR